ncbi:MAG: ompA [Rhodospirillaceae bacterium]|nr:MAG: ompA [Rhodospirillaceae bacterium]
MAWNRPLRWAPFAAMILPATAMAQSSGFYLGGAAGMHFPNDSHIEGGAIKTDGDLDPGAAGLLSGGFAFQNGLRTELEAGYRSHEVGGMGGVAVSSGDVRVASLMGNLFYDFHNASAFTPYIGAGLGGAWMKFDTVALPGGNTLDTSDLTLAYQGIAGLDYTITDRLHSFADYRYFGTLDAGMSTRAGQAVDASYDSHGIMLGVRWSFGAPRKAPLVVAAAPPPPPPAPEPMRPETPPAPRDYIVFFDFDQAALTPEAQHILAAAAADAKATAPVRIELTGHTDRSGTDHYNFALSLRRVDTVKADLVTRGLRVQDIGVQARGEAEPLVITSDGVREPQNRRVEIIVRRP